MFSSGAIMGEIDVTSTASRFMLSLSTAVRSADPNQPWRPSSAFSAHLPESKRPQSVSWSA